MLEQNVTRRTALKTGGVLAVGAAAGLYVANGLKLPGVAGENPAASGSGGRNSNGVGSSSSKEPLILMVKGEEVSVYQGTTETKIVDAELSRSLFANFGSV